MSLTYSRQTKSMKTSSLTDLNMKISHLIFSILLCSTAFSQTLSQNAHKNPFGGGWECNRGFKQVGNECQKVQLPANAVLDILGNDWECKRGFKRTGNECGKLTIPANASIDILGNDWICNKGFKRSASECQQMADGEKKSEADRDKALRDEIKRRQARGARGNHCDSEYRSGANVCVTVKNAELACSEAYDGSSYDSCRVEVSLYIETDYRGRGYVDGRVKCEASVSTMGSSGYESTQTNDERWSFSLYANDSSTRSIDIDFSFSNYDKVRKVWISDLTCRVRDLYTY